MIGSVYLLTTPILLFFFLNRLEWCKLVERGEAFCLSSHGQKRWSGARATASFHTWLEPGQAANAFLRLSGYLLETHKCCSAAWVLEAGRKKFQQETYVSEGWEGRGAGKEKSDASTELGSVQQEEMQVE